MTLSKVSSDQGIQRLDNRVVDKVLWTDKSKFKIFGSNKKVYVWQRVGERAAIPCITPTVKHRGGSVIVCRAFASCKVGGLHQVESKLNQISYHSILQAPGWFYILY